MTLFQLRFNGLGKYPDEAEFLVSGKLGQFLVGIRTLLMLDGVTEAHIIKAVRNAGTDQASVNIYVDEGQFYSIIPLRDRKRHPLP